MPRSDEVRGDPPFDVVIVTPTYLSSNPRVVKEADALSAAGLRVSVVFSQGQVMWARSEDAGVIDGRRWPARAVRWSASTWGERRTYWRSAVRFHAARRLASVVNGPLWLAKYAECRTYPELARAAEAVPARLYIGHYPEGLAAAAYAAERHGAQLGYDAEDLHTGEEPPSPRKQPRSERIARIEARHLGDCAYVTAVSHGVAEALAERYDVAMPVVVHNTFPWSDRQSIDGLVKDRRGPAVSVYWYSQVIGLDRGLQDAIQALARVREPFQLHIRGFCSGGAAKQLRTLADDVHIADRVFVHGRVAPHELLSRTMEHDVGLALEQPVSHNKAQTVANKVFFYLLAGLGVVATTTPGQLHVLQQVPGVADLYPPGDIDALAGIFDRLLSDRAFLARRKQAAAEAARTRWNWEMEQQTLVDVVRAALADPYRRVSRSRSGSSRISTLTDAPAGR